MWAVDEGGNGGLPVSVRTAIEVGDATCWTSFDIGVRNTYVIPSVARRLTTSPMLQPIRTPFGETNTTALLNARVEGCPIPTLAFVVDEIGRDENGTFIEVVFGALSMRQWGIRPIPGEQRLDLSHYSDIFVEY